MWTQPRLRLLAPSLAVASRMGAKALSTTPQARGSLKVDNLLILGGGLMGSGIAQSCAASAKFQSIVLQDVDDKAVEKARLNVATSLTRMQKKVPTLNVDEIMSRITFSTKVEPKSDTNLLVIEAVFEKLDLKQNIFKKLSETYGKADSVIWATNTSSLACRDIGKYVTNPARYAGLHFFSPVPLMKLVEIVRVDNGTDDATYDALVQFVKDIGKVSVKCKDTPGFIVNRLMIPYMFEAISMLERGDASAKDIDTAMKLGAGYPMGPFELQDMTGIDLALHISETFKERDGTPIVKPSNLIRDMVKKGHFGRKSGKGFYDYPKK